MMERLRKTFGPVQGAAALVLLLAIAAVLVLGRDTTTAEPAPIPAVPASAAADKGIPMTMVTADMGARAKGRVLGDKKNPFRPEPQPKKAASGKASTETGTGSTTGKAVTSTGTTPSLSAGVNGTGTGSTTAGGGGSTTVRPTPTPTATPTPTPVVPGAVAAGERVWTPVVRWGATDARLRTRRVRRLTALPRADAPLAVLTGLRRDHTTSVWVIAPGTIVTGSGRCVPAPESCKQLELPLGGVAYLFDGSKEYRVELLKVRSARVTEQAATTARRVVAPGGRKALRSLLSQVGSLRYDADSATVTGSYR